MLSTDMENGRPCDRTSRSTTGQQSDGRVVETHDNPTIITDDPLLETPDHVVDIRDNPRVTVIDTFDNPRPVVRDDVDRV